MTMQPVMDSIPRDRLADLVCQLVAIPSVTNHEHRIADVVYDLFTQIGLSDIRRVPVDESGDSLIGAIRGPSGGPVMMLNFHIDTFDVCGGWETDPFRPVIRDGRVYGLGAHDMKGGAACVLAVVEALVASGITLGGTLLVSATTDEENWSRGAHALINSGLLTGCSACLIPEPALPGTLRIGARGRHVIHIDLTGKTAHAAYTGEGINAVADGARVILALEQIDLGWDERFQIGGSLCVIEFAGGRNLILVPEHARITIDRHILPGQTVDEAVRQIDEAIRAAGIRSSTRITCDDRPTKAPGPYVVDEASPFVRSAAARVEEQLGQPVRYALARSVADTNHFAVHAGIPTLAYGPEGGNTCQANEYVDLDSMVRVARVYCGIVGDVLGPGS